MGGTCSGVPHIVAAIGLLAALPFSAAQPDDRLQSKNPPGISGGRLVSVSRFEPRTLNWVVASDTGSREVLQFLMADLIHINRDTQKPEPALARSWTVSPDGLHWVLELRRGLQFSDGHPFDADDVLFTFQVIFDERSHSPQRDLLTLEGKPIAVRKLSQYRVAFDLPVARAVADRLFDRVYILPRHKLEAAWKAGRFADAWSLSTPPSEIAGLGPFRLKSYTAGQQTTLERNPHYWKVDAAGKALPYLDEVTFVVGGSEDNQVLRFQNGESDVINRVSAKDYAVLEAGQRRRGYELRDLGASMEISVLAFNLSDLPVSASREVRLHQSFLRRTSLRQAISAAIDRAAIVRLVYRGRATALAGTVPPGDRGWVNTQLPPPVRSLDRARQLLTADGFQFRNGQLFDPAGKPVEFSILVSNSTPERQQVATMIQDDLKPLGIRVNLVPMDFPSIGERVQRTRQFEAAMLGFATADADPNPDLVIYLSSGGNHLWNPSQKSPASPWEAEIDDLMRRQQVELKYGERKRLFDRVQEIMAQNLPMIPLVSPNILVGAKRNLGNFRPSLLEPHTLWNLDQLYWRGPGAGGR
jgi:peptide/nickel transport system substrate-binding protein